MSEILSIGGGNTPVQGIGQRRGVGGEVGGVSGGGRAGDSVEVSQTAQLLAKLSELPDVRQDLVDGVKEQIASGAYDADGSKFDAAFDAMIDDILN